MGSRSWFWGALSAGVVLLSLAACGGGENGMSAPFLKIRGTVAAANGEHAKDCKLALSDIVDGRTIAAFDIAEDFSVRYSDASAYDSSRGAYRGLRFYVSCADHPVSAARVYSGDQIAASNMDVNLGDIVVWDGNVYVHGNVVDQDGSWLWGCVVGLFTPGYERPLKTMMVVAGLGADFNLSGTGDRFTFEAICPESARRGASKVYTVDMIDPGNPQIVVGNLVVPH